MLNFILGVLVGLLPLFALVVYAIIKFKKGGVINNDK